MPDLGAAGVPQTFRRGSLAISFTLRLSKGAMGNIGAVGKADGTLRGASLRRELQRQRLQPEVTDSLRGDSHSHSCSFGTYDRKVRL